MMAIVINEALKIKYFVQNIFFTLALLTILKIRLSTIQAFWTMKEIVKICLSFVYLEAHENWLGNLQSIRGSRF